MPEYPVPLACPCPLESASPARFPPCPPTVTGQRIDFPLVVALMEQFLIKLLLARNFLCYRILLIVQKYVRRTKPTQINNLKPNIMFDESLLL